VAGEKIELKSKDGLKLSGLRWTPDNQIRGGIILVHGLGEHSLRYHHVADKFNQHEYLFQAMDFRGHGLSDGKRGHAESLQKLLEDVDAGIQKFQEDYPRLPLILYGHSMGGKTTCFKTILKFYQDAY